MRCRFGIKLSIAINHSKQLWFSITAEINRMLCLYTNSYLDGVYRTTDQDHIIKGECIITMWETGNRRYEPTLTQSHVICTTNISTHSTTYSIREFLSLIDFRKCIWCLLVGLGRMRDFNFRDIFHSKRLLVTIFPSKENNHNVAVIITIIVYHKWRSIIRTYDGLKLADY